MKSMGTRWVLIALLALAAIALTCTLSGCSVWKNRPRLRERKIDMQANVDQVPPIKVVSLNGKTMLIMQAPHSGWAIGFDRDELVAHGVRLMITVRRPDPSFMYPQAIVEKNLLTQIDADESLEIYARILDANEKIDWQGYGRITPVDSFDE